MRAVVTITAVLLVSHVRSVQLQKSLDFIRQELSKNENLKMEELKKYVDSIAPAYIVKKGDRSLEQLTVDSIRENRFEYHRYLTDYRFHNVIDPDLPRAAISVAALAFILVLVMLMILCSQLRNALLKTVKKNISKRINEISKDLLILLLIVASLKVVDYFRVLRVAAIMIVLNDIQLLLSVFCLLYVTVNVACIAGAQNSISKWVDYESYVPDRVEVYREFERMFTDFNDGVLLDDKKAKFDKIKKVVKYISLRQEFLSPTFFPLLKESVLRDDFPFSDYLGKAYYKTLGEVASLRQFSIACFVIMFFCYILIRLLLPEVWEVYAMVLFSILIFFALYILKKISENIFYRLSRPMKSPYEFSVQPFDAVRNPLANLDKILTPHYLRDNFEKCYISDRRIINSHEALFVYSSPSLFVRLIHLCVFSQIIWIIILFTNYTEDLDSWLTVLLVLVATGLAAVSLFIHFPATCRNLALILNIEMMKDQALIEEVVAEKKAETGAAFCKFYRLMKRMNRQKFGDESSSEQSERDEAEMINLIIVSCRNAFAKLKTVVIVYKGLKVDQQGSREILPQSGIPAE